MIKHSYYHQDNFCSFIIIVMGITNFSHNQKILNHYQRHHFIILHANNLSINRHLNGYYLSL